MTYTIQQVGMILGVCDLTVHNWIKRQRILPATKVGGKWLIHEQDLRRFMEPNRDDATCPLDISTDKP